MLKNFLIMILFLFYFHEKNPAFPYIHFFFHCHKIFIESNRVTFHNSTLILKTTLYLSKCCNFSTLDMERCKKAQRNAEIYMTRATIVTRLQIFIAVSDENKPKSPFCIVDESFALGPGRFRLQNLDLARKNRPKDEMTDGFLCAS